MRLFQTLVALVTGAIAALLWVERQTSSRPAPLPDPPAAPPASSPTQPPTQPPPEPERVVEQVVVADPEQSARIEELEAELEEQRAIRTSEPDEPPPSIDAIRAARARAYELERQLTQTASGGSPGWPGIATPALEEMIDAVAEHLPLVALRSEINGLDASALWTAMAAMQQFAEACAGDWFEFHGNFARWCLESGHPAALEGDQLGIDEERPTFAVEERVNRSGRQVVPTYVLVGESRLYYVDDVAGETGRMHVVGVGNRTAEQR